LLPDYFTQTNSLVAHDIIMISQMAKVNRI